MFIRQTESSQLDFSVGQFEADERSGGSREINSLSTGTENDQIILKKVSHSNRVVR